MPATAKKKSRTLKEIQATHRRWRLMYGTERTNTRGEVLGVWTYRAIAEDSNVDPTTVWAALNPDKVRTRSQGTTVRGQRETRPLSVRIALTQIEYEVLRATAVERSEPGRRVSMMALARGVIFGEQPSLALPAPMPDEPVLEDEPELIA